MKILVIDNYDSFTYNLVHYIEKFNSSLVEVYRNDELSLWQIKKYDKIVLSPGPGLPEEAGILMELIEKYAATKSILGVCLGHQAIAQVFGGKLINLNRVYHGVSSTIKILNNKEPLFNGLPKQFRVGRYHSWIVAKENLPDCFEITSVDEDGQIMSISHKKYNLKGVQFHPESVLTEYGEKIIYNWLEN